MAGLRMVCGILKPNLILRYEGIRNYSRYSPKYIEPIYNPQKIHEMEESGEAEECKFTPIKATYNKDTSSVFHDEMLTKFTNYIMKSGHKVLARDLVQKAFEEIKHIQVKKWREAETEEDKAQIQCNPLIIFHNAVENCRPIMNLVPIKRGGIVYQVPVPLTEKRSYWLSMKWLIESGREKERTIHFPYKMARELISASKNEGRVVKKKQDLHRQCENNRAYAHYRWS